jgi:hypothetical protein
LLSSVEDPKAPHLSSLCGVCRQGPQRRTSFGWSAALHYFPRRISMGRPRKDTSSLSAEEVLRLERDRQRKNEVKEIERLSKVTTSGEQSPDAVRVMWATNLKSMDAKKREALEAHKAQWILIHKYLRDPFRLGEDILDLVIDDVEAFVAVCPLSPNTNGGDILSVYDQLLYFGVLDEYFNEFALDQMPPYFKKYGQLLDFTNAREYRSFQTKVVRWYLKNRHRAAAEFGWNEDAWPKIEQYSRSVPGFSQIKCCDRFDSSAPLCTANPTCWRLQTASTITPEPNSSPKATGLTAKEVALRRKLDIEAHMAQLRMTKTIEGVSPLYPYCGRND